jgi:hypothetical protein
VIYRIGDKLAGLDLFGSQTAFERAFPKLLRGSALQALAGFDNDGGGQADDGQFLHAVFNVTADRFPAVGLGEELRFDTDQIGGGALETRPSVRLPATPEQWPQHKESGLVRETVEAKESVGNSADFSNCGSIGAALNDGEETHCPHRRFNH